MKYAIVKVVNGNFSIDSEGYTDVKNAIVNYFGLCQSLWNAPDVVTASVTIVDENNKQYTHYAEYIDKTVS